jgi:uncharacterized repeat protein (TIGR01451 family)
MRKSFTLSFCYKSVILSAFIVFLFSNISNAQLSVNISTSGVSPVPTGQDICFDVSYTWSSTTQDLMNGKIEIPIPLPLSGNNANDVGVFVSSHVASASYDPGSRKITWNMISPLPAGSSGTIKFCVHFENGTTTNNSTVTIGPNFTGTGQTLAASSTTITSAATSKATIVKSLRTDPALDNEASYLITVSNDQGNGNYNLTNVVVTDQLPAGSTFLRATGGGTESGGVVTWNIPTLNIGEVKYYRVVIKYPAGSFNIGDDVSNSVTLNGTSPEGAIPGVTSTKTNKIASPNAAADIAKYSWTDWMSLKGSTGYSINNYNTGNVPLTNIVMEDNLPAEFNMTQLGLGIDGNGSTNHAVVEYQTKNNPTWQTWPGSPFTLPANPSSPDRTYLNVVDLGFDPYAANPTDYITKFRITMDQMAVNYEPSPGTYYSGFAINADKNGTTYSMPKEITNVLDFAYTGAGNTITGTQTDLANVVGVSPKPYVDKSRASGYDQQPLGVIKYNFRLFNRWEASDVLKNPFLADLLPPDIKIDPTITDLSGPIGAPTLTVVDNFNNTGRQLLKFNWPNTDLAIGGDQYWSMNAKIKAGAAPGERQNLLLFMGADNAILNLCDNPQYVRDTFDIDGDGRTLNDTLPASTTTSYNIIETTAIESYKYVKGECDTHFHKFPEVGKTVQNGTFQYKLYVYNIGNKALTNIKTMDILPWVGDVGVITHNAARDSKYQPTFVSMDYVPSGITVKYSNSNNPCRAELDPTISEPGGGCDANTFSSTIPSNLADIKSLIFDFGSIVIQPGDSLELRWTMRVPYGVAPGDASWNSFGHRSESTTGTKVPPAEPIKVGVTVKAAKIGDYVWLDTNKNGLQDDGPTGVADVTVHLLDQNMAPVINPQTNQPVTTTTDASGYYFFNVNPGTYFVQFDTPNGYAFTKTNEGGDDNTDSDVGVDGKTTTSITVVDGDTDLKWDAGLKLCVQPTLEFTSTAGTCNGATSNNDAVLNFSNIVNSDKADFIEGSAFGTTPAYGDGTNVNSTSGTLTFSSLKHNTAYTFRFWNGENSCFKDTTITTPTISCVLPCNITVNIASTDVKCNAGTDGTATATTTGNISAVGYVWSNGATTDAITGLTAGVYTVTVTETPTCSTTGSVTITEPSDLTLACAKTDATTTGGSDGTATVTATGGTSPYTYIWSNGATTDAITSLTAGTYTVTVTDAKGCSDVCSSQVNEPGCNLTASATGTNVSCNAGTNGTATATPTGNLAAVTYIWSNGETTATISNLTAGTYAVTVTESANCVATANYTVTEPSDITLACAKTDVTTISGSDGTATVTATGGTSPYTYVWSNGATTASITSLTAGTYTVTVADANGCSDVCNSQVNEPGCNLTASATGTNVTCNAGTNGTATATPSGNLSPVTYVWSNGETTATISTLTAGTYAVTVTESANCVATANYTVTEPSDITLACAKTDATTNGGNDGTATVTATGGTSPYTYLWSNGATTASITSLTAGTYTVTVTDANGCSDICNSQVNEPSCNLTASATGTNVSCHSGTNGTATATPTGNLSPVTYVWSNGETTATISNLTAGTYTVTVTESANCVATANYIVTEPSDITLACAKTDVTTTGGSDGTATVTATGGTSPYTYLWTNGATTDAISGLTAGTYTVTVADANGCSDICSSQVNEPGCNLTASATGTNVTCNAENNGTATATPTGNLSPVTYVWSNGATTASITTLAAGTYNVTVTESANCTATANYIVTEPSDITLACAKTDVTTTGGNNGTATVTATGGTSPYTYLWSNGVTTASITSLTAGTHTVTVTDANGCSDVCSSQVNEPGCNLTASATGTNVTCNAGNNGTATATPTGNLSPVTYVWSNGATTAAISNLTAGTYAVTVTESANCTTTANYIVTEPSDITLACAKTDVTTISGSDGTATVTATGGTSPYTYLWSNGATTASITGLTAGTFTVTVTDANGCSDICGSQINEPGCNLAATTVVTQPSCSNNDGAITLSITGANAPTFLWSNGAITKDINGLSSGDYTVTITDGNCTITASDSLTIKNTSIPYYLCVGEQYLLEIDNLALTNIQWYKNGILISGAVASTYIATSAGIYTYTSNNISGCNVGQCCPIEILPNPNCCKPFICAPVKITRKR